MKKRTQLGISMTILTASMIACTGQVAQASEILYDVCTPEGSGGGTWDVLKLCADSHGNLFVLKRDGGKFKNGGTMTLFSSAGYAHTKEVKPGQSVVPFLGFIEGCYQAHFRSDEPGIAWTDRLCIDPQHEP